jgi:hypothetical protein
MDLLPKLALLAGCLLVFGFGAIVVLQIVVGRISLAGLLVTKGTAGGPDDESYSPARLQLLIFTVVVAAQYLHAVVVNPSQDSLPALPRGVVAALGGSHAVYLGGKALTTFIQPLLKHPK